MLNDTGFNQAGNFFGWPISNYMIKRVLSVAASLLILTPVAMVAQSPATGVFVPGVTYQTTNPNYFQPNPFYFEGRIDWNLLKITQPANAWDYAQRGIHEQDDLSDPTDAIADYQQSISMNNLTNGTCQIVSTPLPANGQLNPPPCMFTVRLRLAGLLAATQPLQAIGLYNQVVAIDPLRLGVHAAIAATYVAMAQAAQPDAAPALYAQAVTEYQNELALSPVTAVETKATGDVANNAHVHWALSEIYRVNGDLSNQIAELDLYLKATQWHSDTYPWRIALAQARMAEARGKRGVR
jgi:tetratricopeptide (TPR) repeat protein